MLPQAAAPDVEVLEGVDGAFPTEEGTLTYNDGGCVGIELRTGFTPVAFPDGSAVLPDGSGVEVPRDANRSAAQFAFGSSLEATTGMFSSNLAVDLSPACEAESLAGVTWE